MMGWLRYLPFCLFTLLPFCGLRAQDGFTAEPIPDAVWQKMQGKTYVDNPHIGRSDLRYLRVLHWDYDHQTHQGATLSSASAWLMSMMPTMSVR